MCPEAAVSVRFGGVRIKRTSCFGFNLDVFGRSGLVGLDSVRVCSDKASLSVWTRSGGVRMKRDFDFGSARGENFGFISVRVFGCGEPFGLG